MPKRISRTGSKDLTVRTTTVFKAGHGGGLANPFGSKAATWPEVWEDGPSWVESRPGELGGKLVHGPLGRKIKRTR